MPNRRGQEPATLTVRRAATARLDAWDTRAAVVIIDGIERGELHLGQCAKLRLSAGEHELGIRLQHHFAPATTLLRLPPHTATTVTCTKGSDHVIDLLAPNKYWLITIDTAEDAAPKHPAPGRTSVAESVIRKLAGHQIPPSRVSL